MKIFFYSIFLIFVFICVSIIIYLSTFGIEISKFNNQIIREIEKKAPNVQLELEKIKIKLDLKKIQLFLSTNNPKIKYQDIKIPITKIEIYAKLNKILNSKIEINKTIFAIEKFKTEDVQKIAIRIKPSNFKTYLLNNINGGEIEKASFDLSTDKNFRLIDYKANGSIKKTNVVVSNDFTLKDVSFNFIVDSELTLINSINASYDGITISNGSIDLQKKKDIEIKGKFNSQFNLKGKQLSKLFKKVKIFKEYKIYAKGSLLHEFNLKVNNRFKIINYEYRSNGNILESQVNLKKAFKNKFFIKPIKKIIFKENKLAINLSKQNKNQFLIEGLYSTGGLNYKKYIIKNNLKKKNLNYIIDLDLDRDILLDIINYKTDSTRTSKVKIDFNLKNNRYIFNKLDFKENKNFISIKGLVLNHKNEIQKLSSIKVVTFNQYEENNNFIINFEKKISILGKKYDSTNLIKLLSGKSKFNPFKNFSKEIEIQLTRITTKSGVPLNNFSLIGLIKKGKLSKISAKSDFSEDKYLDITLDEDPKNKKILEIYSDSPQAILSDYKFFEGVRDGKLLFNSIGDETGSVSKITIENFKVIKAPAFATLLTLADLRGFADLLSGQGMSFNILEINLKEDASTITVEEILALGSSVSLHMKGYIEKKTDLISLSGTLVPAKTLNNLVSKIPFIGNILVGDKVGEGVFGVSFKMKGLPGKVKTTVNPVKTLTPRFITRAIEKMKKN